MKLLTATAAIAFSLTSFCALAADYPAPKQGDFIARDFKFHTGEVIVPFSRALIATGGKNDNLCCNVGRATRVRTHNNGEGQRAFPPR